MKAPTLKTLECSERRTLYRYQHSGKSSDKDEYVELEFEAGVPVAVNGEKLSPAALLEN